MRSIFNAWCRIQFSKSRSFSSASAHLIFEHAAVFGKDFVQIRLRELLAGDVGEHDAVSERHDRLALIRVTRRMEEDPVALDQLHHIEHVAAGLFEGADRSNRSTGRHELHIRLGRGRNRVHPPVFHLEHQQPFCRVDDDKVGVPATRPHGQVVPDVGVLFEEVFEAFGQAQLAAAVEARGAKGGDQGRHELLIQRVLRGTF
jgi:hypothetical protein